MTLRERFNNVWHWKKVDEVPNLEFGYWDETIPVWHQQGLPAYIKTSKDIERYLHLEGSEILPRAPVINGLYPRFEPKVLEDGPERRIISDNENNICEVSQIGSSIPRFIKFGLATREDWEVYKRERLDYTRPDRIGNMKKAIAEAHQAGLPVLFDGGSIYGLLRNWMGMENLAIAIVSERDWVEEMMEHLTEMTLYLIDKALKDVDAANGTCVGWWWEDMCYNRGPLISPKMFEELMVPRYKRITDAFKKHKVDVHILDCDGRIYELVPGWLKGGINCMFPIEAAHTDPLELRRSYGHEVLLFGGVNKVALIKGKDAIDRELERLHPLVQQGGYIPCVDHRVPPDVTWENYLYYLEKKKEIL